MQNLSQIWADKPSLGKFFIDAPGMDIQARLKYFHDVFPFAESLPINFYLFDANEISIACNQTTLSNLGDIAITDYVDRTCRDYAIQKGWPKCTFEQQIENNRVAIVNGHTTGHETTKDGNYLKKWISRKDAIYDDNGCLLGLIGLSTPIGLSSESIHWNGEKMRVMLMLNESLQIALSLREFTVLKGLLNGGTAHDIAKIENISPKTVETYIMKLKFKFNCPKQRDIISLLIKNSMAKEIVEFSVA